MITLSANTQAVLLLTAPLLSGQSETSPDLLRPGEYQRVAKLLSQLKLQPSDLLSSDGQALPTELKTIIDTERVKLLLGRGFQLSQAVDRWQTRSIWVASPTDDEYPTRIKERLKDHAPPVVYGCGNAALLDSGGLAVVGSRDVNEWLIEYTESIGRLASQAKQTLVSGGARGIDQASMRGALGAGGKTIGVLADSLERGTLNREHRDLLMDDRLVLISPYDPQAGFNVGHAMQRNKLIYALADAALVVNSDHEKGGTWAGAIEQLEKLHFVPVYVRSEGDVGEGLEALRRKGALPWPNPKTADEFIGVLSSTRNETNEAEQLSFL